MSENDKIKVLFIASVFPNMYGGGIADYTYNLIKHLSNESCEVHLLTSDDPVLIKENLFCKIYPDMKSWSKDAFRTVRKAVDEINPDIIHIQHDTISYKDKKPLLNFLPLLLGMHYPRIKKITTIHEFREHRLRWKLRILFNLIFSDECILVDRWDLKVLEKQFFFIPKKKLAYIPIASNIIPSLDSGISKSIIREKLGLKKEDLIVFHFGRISPHKGVDFLLDAFEHIADKEKNARLLLISGLFSEGYDKTEYQKNIVKRIKESKFKDRILTLKSQDKEKLSLYILASDIGVFPFTFGATYQRGSFLASLAHGLPTITSYDPSFYPDSIVNGDDAIFIETKNIDSLSKELMELIKNEKKREKMKVSAKEFYEKHFSWSKIAKETRNLYNRLRQN